MNKFFKIIAAALFVMVTSHAQAQRGRIVGKWLPNDSASCVSTCARQDLAPVSTGIVSLTRAGDPNLYICKAAIPGAEIHGIRAGYNWNGSIGSNVQPGCTVVGGRGGYTHVRSFECLCENSFGIIGDRE